MKQVNWRPIALACILALTSPLYSMPSDDDVAQWTGGILLETISVNYNGLEEHSKLHTIGKYYSGQAKTGLRTFFSTLIPFIIRNKISTVPEPINPPKIIHKGEFNGTPYWQVTQSFRLPEVNKKIWFSVVVIKTESPPLLIESISVKMDF